MDPNTQSADSEPSDKVLHYSPRRSWGPQISLAMMIALVTIAALGFGYYVLSYRFAQKIEKANAENALLKQQIKQLKKDFAVLEVTDPNLIHAIQLPVFENDTYRYRLYLPPQKKYVLKYTTEAIPKDGYPRSVKSQPIQANNQRPADEAELVIRRDKDSLSIHYPNGGAMMTSLKPIDRNGLTMSTFKGVERGKVEVQKPGEPFLIIRKRTVYSQTKNGLGEDDIPDLAESGLLFWIEETNAAIKPATNSATKTNSESP